MDDQKDRFGDKIRDLEKVREDQWAREQDQALLEKIRARQGAALYCPKCSAQLVAQAIGELTIMACANGDGAWLDGPALERLVQAWTGR
jgi:Transcription factor zinc-finger